MDNGKEDDPRLGIGGNGPPEPTPFEVAASKIGDLYDEAKLWLDGEEVATPELADGIGNLLNAIRNAEKAAEKAREEEKRPYLEAGRAVDAAYKPLLAKAKRAASACKEALQPWLEKLEEENRRKAGEANAAAAAALAEAQAFVRGADRANLAAVDAAEALLSSAKKITAGAKRAETATAKAGSHGRAVSLRTSHSPVMIDPAEALKHYKVTEPQAVKEFLQSLAVRDVRAGKRTIPGFDVIETKTAV